MFRTLRGLALVRKLLHSQHQVPRAVQHCPFPCSSFELVKCFSAKATNSSLLESAKALQVTWDNGSLDNYPYVWLRDNCQCPECFHHTSSSRTINLMNFSLDSRPVELINGDESITLKWDDNHVSSFPLKWLQSRSFATNSQRNWTQLNHPDHILWGTELQHNFPTVDFEAVMKDDATLLQWLSHLQLHGVALIDNVPDKLGQVRHVAERIAFIKKTHYGEEFSVQAKADPSNVAYTGGHLQLHTDLPYYEYKPGVNLLHCLIQYKGQGGESQISDGFKIAEVLRSVDPAAFDLLSTLSVDWSDIGVENGNGFHKVHRSPVICIDRNDRYQRINFSQPQRDSHLPVPYDKVELWYKALKKFCQFAHDPRYLVQFKLKPGQMLTFNNLRILHGRTAFGHDFGGERHVQGAYVDWDEIHSRIRVLRSELFL